MMLKFSYFEIYKKGRFHFHNEAEVSKKLMLPKIA